MFRKLFHFAAIFTFIGTNGLGVWAQSNAPDPTPGVEAVAPITVTSDKSNICAGGVDSEPHRTTVTASLSSANGAEVSGKGIRFTIENSDPDYPAYIKDASADGSRTVSTDSDGNASVTLISSHLIGSTTTVKGTYGEAKNETSVTTDDAEGEMTIDADELVADGQSEADVYLTLSHQGLPVNGHAVSFRIVSVKNSEGVAVQASSDGSFPGYGILTTVQGTTDESGVAYATYKTGTLPGVITFESADYSALKTKTVSDGSSAGNSGSFSTSRAGSYSGSSSPDVKKPSTRYQDTSPKLEVIYPTVSFFFISDSGNPKHSTIKNESSIGPIIKGANKAWFPPAQIVFLKRRWYNISVSGDLTDYVSTQNIASIIDAGVEKADSDRSFADLYTFCVWGLQSERGNVILGKESAAGEPYCFLVDSAQFDPGKVLAHEAGHVFGLLHPIELDEKGKERPEGLKYKSHLMYPLLYGGTFIPKDQVSIARAGAKALIDARKALQ